jgi:antitoxin ParD1/3/4
MNVSLTPELEKFVANKVATGRYSSASEVVRAGLRILEEEERWLVYARDRIAQGIEELKAGKFVTKEQFLANIAERKRKRA